MGVEDGVGPGRHQIQQVQVVSCVTQQGLQAEHGAQGGAQGCAGGWVMRGCGEGGEKDMRYMKGSADAYRALQSL
jgi:hypothetical protein